MGLIITPKQRIDKPQVGTQINWGHPLASKLIGCFPLGDHGAREIVSSVTGTLGSSAAIVPDVSILGRVHNFVSASYINYGVPKLFNNVQAPITISGWVNPSSLTGNRTIISRYWQTTNHRLLWLARFEGGTLKLYLSKADGSYQSFTGYAVSTNTWTHVSITVSGAVNVTFYKNGIFSSSSSGVAVSATPDETTRVQIGESQAASGENFLGLMSFITVHSRELSASEITQLYSNPYQIFEQRRFWWIGPPSGAETVSATPNAGKHKDKVTSPSVIQTHVLSGSTIKSNHKVISPSLIQTHILEVGAARHVDKVISPAAVVTEETIVTADPNASKHKQLITSPILIQTHVLTIGAAKHTDRVTSPVAVITEEGILTLDTGRFRQQVTSPSIIQTHYMTVGPEKHKDIVVSPSIEMTIPLTGGINNHKDKVTSPTVIQTHIIASDAGKHRQLVVSPSMIQTHYMTMNAGKHNDKAVSPSLVVVTGTGIPDVSDPTYTRAYKTRGMGSITGRRTIHNM